MIDNKAIQEFLKIKGGYAGLIDGKIGKLSLMAIDTVLGTKASNWSDARKLIAIEQTIYNDAGIPAGTVDGFVGEQTRYARSVWDARKIGDKTVETWRDTEPPSLSAAPSKWPKESEVPDFFGPHGQHQVMLDLPFPMRIAWEPDKTVSRTGCHEKVKDAFGRIWSGVLKHYGLPELRRLRLDMFGGCFNDRLKRGSTTQRSMHAWGIAWDVDPDRNQLKWGRDLASLDDPPYEPFWKIVEGEGMSSLGRLKNYDWMHWEAARL